ncbi:hypothetical protein HLX02_004656 [Escherichia coli]|nr:hypothetical protein [Escherichia coli]EFU8304122.1 hypothetical protein [Escherichia coli]EIA0307320.1 hypothetical protein [Escherichia coli]
MKQMTLIEMDGFLKGKCIPRDLKVNETNAEYLVRKFGELESKLETALRECRSAGITIDNLEAKCTALAAENAGLKAAFDKPQAYLSWHTIPPTWEDPLPCGEYLDVHDDAGHKNSDGTDCWPVYAKPEINTPVTDAFLAEVRASGVDASIEHLIKKLEGTGHIGVPVMALEWLAQKLRKGGAA